MRVRIQSLPLPDGKGVDLMDTLGRRKNNAKTSYYVGNGISIVPNLQVMLKKARRYAII
jgi:hypothetical protein